MRKSVKIIKDQDSNNNNNNKSSKKILELPVIVFKINKSI